MPYLFCEKCGGYYQLQADENPEDFESCQCNGKLIFRDDISENNFQETKSSPKSDKTIIYKDQYYTEKMTNKYYILSIFGKFLLIIGAVVFIFSFNLLPLLTCLLGFILIIYGSENIKTWQKGASGEKKISNYLQDIPRGYYVFTDVKLPQYGGNLDHVVVGPTGIFVIETKNYNGYYILDGDNWLIYKKSGLEKAYGNPGLQARKGAIELITFLAIKGINVKWIKPLFTVLSGKVKVQRRHHQFDYVHPGELVDYITNKHYHIDEKSLKAVAAFLVDYSTEFSF